MREAEAARIYAEFVDTVVRSRAAYSIQGADDPVAVYDPLGGAIPLWSVKADADLFIPQYWPELKHTD